MNSKGISGFLKNASVKTFKISPLLLLLLVGMIVSVKPAQAQSSDTWKSVAIIGGSTLAGAYIGHKIGGTTGAYVGAAAGASTGYAIDRWRRQNEYNNGYYGNNGGYYGNNGPYYGGNYPPNDNGGYYGGPYGYQSGYRSHARANSRRR
jgi:hypothetical protein